MKIVLIGPVYPYRGGIAHFTTALAGELLRAGHQVQVISFARQYPAWLYPGKSDKDPSLQHEQVEARYLLDPLYLWTWRRALSAIYVFQPDLVIAQWWTTFWSLAYAHLGTALRRRGIPLVFCIHNVLPHENRLPDRALARWVLGKGSGYITFSPKETGRLEGLLAHPRVFAARLPVPRLPHTRLDPADARRALQIPPDQPTLLFFGIVRPYKGLSVAIEALSLLKKEPLRPTLLVAGEFWEDEEKYRRQIEQLGLGAQVKIDARYIPNEELETFFRAADGFVAPYLNGTQSAAIKTAMSYGLPILASDQIASDLPADDYPILIHRAGDAAQLAGHMRACIQQDWPGQPARAMDDWSSLVALIEQIRGRL